MKRVVNINWFDVWDAIKKGKEVCVLRYKDSGVCIEFNRLTFMMVAEISRLIESCRAGEDVVFFSVEDGEE